jgi:iron-sulfur cluster assembly protein
MSVSLTPAAARHVEKSLTRRGGGIGLRLAVKTSGCSGFAYALEFVDAANPDDECFETHGVKIVVDARSLGILDGTELDFVREGLNEGFKFNNPNARANCGCGESFAV